MSKPKACPFCGSNDIMVQEHDDQEGVYFVAECDTCGARGPINMGFLATIGWDYREAVGDGE